MELEELRRRFKYGLAGLWTTCSGTFEQIMGQDWEFFPDGKGTVVYYSLSGETKSKFRWRKSGPYCVEIREMGSRLWNEFYYGFFTVVNDSGAMNALVETDENGEQKEDGLKLAYLEKRTNAAGGKGAGKRVQTHVGQARNCLKRENLYFAAFKSILALYLVIYILFVLATAGANIIHEVSGNLSPAGWDWGLPAILCLPSTVLSLVFVFPWLGPLLYRLSQTIMQFKHGEASVVIVMHVAMAISFILAGGIQYYLLAVFPGQLKAAVYRLTGSRSAAVQSAAALAVAIIIAAAAFFLARSLTAYHMPPRSGFWLPSFLD